ncbi:MAG: gliding motility-associated C-terminal domain-containing protein [Saprospiraceae bacterium]
MNKFTYFLLLFLAAGRLFGQDCTNLNSPTPIADACPLAPFLCGNYLENYCATNAGMTDDAFGQRSGFLRISPCEGILKLRVSVSDCAAGGTGLVFGLYPEGCDAGTLIFSDTVFGGTSDTLIFNGLEGLETYLLAVIGLNGSECEFNVQVLEGMGTASPGPVDCSCSDGGIGGPDRICTGDAVSYSIGLPSCFLSFSPPVGGNGEYCPPSDACPASLDSFIFVWHIPSVMHFVGDSTGPNVEIALNSDYMGLDTMRHDTIWVSWALVSSAPMDSLTFCECAGTDCSGDFLPMPVLIWHETREYTCVLSCSQPSCEIEGVTYDSPGFYAYAVDECLEIKVSVFQDDPTPLVPTKVICEGESAFLQILNPDPDYSYQWSTGQAGPSISVAPSASTQYFVTATHFSGNCTYTSSVFVSVLPSTQTNFGQIGTITCAQPCVVFQGQSYCQPGNYANQIAQCSTQFFSIGSDPALFQETLPTVTICEGECYDFFGEPICADSTAMHTENCTLYTQQIIVEPMANTDFGLVGSINCAQPCVDFQGSAYCSPGIYTIQNGPCSTKTFEIGENLALPVCSFPFPDCLPSNTHFTVAFSISGQAPFKVNGDTIEGNYFLSNPQANGEQYAFVVEQANGCQTVVSGLFDCAQLCVSDAGQLSGETLHGCAGQTSVQAESLAEPMLAPGDVQAFVLQTDDGALLARNTTGKFNFDPATMNIGETYFAVRNVGPPDAHGFPDPANACTDTSSQQPLVFHALPRVAIGGDTNFCAGKTLALTASGANGYVWDDGSTKAIQEIQNTDETHAGLYSVVGTDANGCTGADSILVEIRPQHSEGCCRPLLPNAFTPNGDGSNDSFVPLLPDCRLEFAEMRVYSRWGEMVFRSSNISDRWDGTTPSGDPANSDTYVFTYRYRLEGDGEKTEKGEVTLLR